MTAVPAADLASGAEVVLGRGADVAVCAEFDWDGRTWWRTCTFVCANPDISQRLCGCFPGLRSEKTHRGLFVLRSRISTGKTSPREPERDSLRLLKDVLVRDIARL